MMMLHNEIAELFASYCCFDIIPSIACYKASFAIFGRGACTCKVFHCIEYHHKTYLCCAIPSTNTHIKNPTTMRLSIFGPLFPLLFSLTTAEIDAGKGSGLTMMTYVGTDCRGEVIKTPDITYSSNYTTQGQVVMSYQLSRDVVSGEQLDFSIPKHGDPCALFTYSVAPSGGGGANGNMCWNIREGGATCYRFWHH